jgi:protein phosphatase
MTLNIPELSLVVLVGVSGSGKSTFGRKHFKATEILSSDACRGLVSDNENNQAATKDAFEVLHFIAAKRLAAGRLTVVDATNVQPEARKPLVTLAREYHCLPVAIVLDVPERLAHDRNRGRADRDFGPHVIRQQAAQLHRSLRGLEREGFRRVHVLRSEEEIAAAEIVRERLWNNRRDEHGPFDIVGDVHGCHDELVELLAVLGYAEQPGGAWTHAAGRRLVFVGDLVDRGPKSPEVVRLVLESVRAGSALAVPGNHDVKFMRKIFGKNVQVAHGLAESLEQFSASEEQDPGFSRVAAEFIDSLVSHYVFDEGRLVVAHAGLKESMQGRGSGGVREFCLFGETTGETDEFAPASAVSVGGRLSRSGDGRLWSYAGAAAGVAEPHIEHRHRLRLRREAHRASLPGKGNRLCSGTRDVRRTAPPLSPTRHADAKRAARA